MRASSFSTTCNVAVGMVLILVGLTINEYVLEQFVFLDRIQINNTAVRVAVWTLSIPAFTSGLALLYFRKRLPGESMLMLLASILFSLLLLEFLGRFINNSAGPGLLLVADDTLVIYDPDTGYRYKPSAASDIAFFAPDEDDAFHTVHFTTNAQGWRSRHDYSYPKASNEFRIAIIGDSFTAGAGSNFSWTDILEHELNERLLNRHDTTFRVFNFGLGGAGFWHFDRIRQKDISNYDVDLLVIAYIHGDIRRKPTWRWSESHDGSSVAVTCLHSASLEDRSSCQVCPVATGAELRELGIRRLRDRPGCRNADGRIGPTLKPVGIAKVLDGVGLSATFYVDSLAGNFEQYSLYAGVKETTRIVRSIQEEADNAIFLHIPLGRSVQESLVDWANTKRIIPELACPRCVSLAEHMGDGDRMTLSDGYVPYDGHHNDKGAAAIGQVAYLALERWIREALARQPR